MFLMKFKYIKEKFFELLRRIKTVIHKIGLFWYLDEIFLIGVIKRMLQELLIHKNYDHFCIEKILNSHRFP